MMRGTQLTVAFVAVLIASAGHVQAAVNSFIDRSTFNAQGSIFFNSNFDDFTSDFSYPGDPFNRGDVTYTSGVNLITGTGTVWSPIRNLLTYDFWSPVTGTIESVATQYDMFGFDIGVLARQDRITISISTNIATYTFALLDISNGTQALEFRGFTTTSPGEYFTSFSLTTENGSGSLPGITDVTLGQLGAPVPEPSCLAIFGIGAGLKGLDSIRRRRREQKRAATD